MIPVAADEANALVALVVRQIGQRRGCLVAAEDGTGHRLLPAGLGAEIVMRTAEIAPELVEAAFQGMEFRQFAEMPFSNEARGVSKFLQTLGKGRLIKRQADIFRIVS